MERTADYADAPGSPLHPEPDQEMGEAFSTEPIAVEDLDFLELNPGIGSGNSDRSPTPPPVPVTKALTKHQQTRFIAYVEEQQLQIQRKLVQSSLNTEAYATLGQALHDISTLVDFIWLSVGDSEAETQGQEGDVSRPRLFGQTQLLLAVAVLPLDALLRVPLTQQEAPALLLLLARLDEKFSRLIDGRILGGDRASGTESVRMGSIAHQTRVLLEEEFTGRAIEGLQAELLSVYTEVLERTGVL